MINFKGGLIMFYCNDCARKCNWPETGFKSRGKCERCGKHADCNERKSSDLPIPKQNQKSNQSC